jgi:autotransporter passenger strand-loop-strand repeat protein
MTIVTAGETLEVDTTWYDYATSSLVSGSVLSGPVVPVYMPGVFTVTDTVVYGGGGGGNQGAIFVYNGGTAIDSVIRGDGGQIVYGVASGTVVSSGGSEQVGSGGVADGTVLRNGGEQFVLGVGDGEGGDGVASGTVVSGGAQIVYGVADGTVLSNGGVQSVQGGVASGTVVDNGGIEEVDFGGVIDGTVVSSGGADYVGQGGVASGTVVDNGGLVDVNNDGTLGGAVVDNGTLDFDFSYGIDSFSGTLTGGGSLVVLGGRTLLVMGGGEAFTGDTTISGGTLELTSASAVGTGPITFASGVLQIDGTTMPTNPISGFAQGDIIDLTGISPDSPISATYNLATAMLSLSDGLSFSIAGRDPVPTFGIKPDGHGGTDLETVPVQTLLDLAYDTYNATPVGADGYSLLEAAPPDAGFAAEAYIDHPSGRAAPDIVIAFRGSNPPSGGWAYFIKNWFFADTAFLTGKLNAVLTEYVKDAATFVAQIYKWAQAAYPGALITLTGHSLGGALAQLVGKAGDFATAAFNAPGAGQLYPQLSSQLSPIHDKGLGGTDINYRISGDVVSLAGAPMGQTFTINSPYTSNNASLIQAIWNAPNNHQKPAFQYLQVTGDYQSGFAGPNPVSIIQAAVQGVETLTTDILSFAFHVAARVAVALDPAAGTAFVFTEAAGSPNFASIGLPFLQGVASYNIAHETGTTWSAYQRVQPGTIDTFPAGVDGIAFDPLNASGQHVAVPGAFLFTATFATSGQLSGALHITGIQPTTVSSGQTLMVSAGQTYSGITVLSGGIETVLSGGTASGTIVDSGGTETVSGGGKDVGTTISGKQYVYGTATSATIGAGGNQYVEAGGAASATIVHSGGRQIVSSGGVASGATVTHDGNQSVFSGGVARGTVLSGGAEIVSAGGTASGTIVDSGGAERVYGRASGGTINGGLVEVASGGTASGAVTFVSGGTLQLDAGAGFTGRIKGFGTPDLLDRIDLRGIAFGSGTTRSFSEAAGNTSGTLTVTSGTHTVHLTLLGLYTTNNFKLATDTHGGTLVTDPPAATGLSLTDKGFNYVDYYNGEYNSTNLKSLSSVAATGADSVALTPDWGIDVATSSVYMGGGTTDTLADLTAAVQAASAEGMTSFVRPLIDILYPQASTAFPGNYFVPNNFQSIFDPTASGATTIAYNPATNTDYAVNTPAGTTPATVPAGTSDGNLVNYRGQLESTDQGGDLNAAKFFGSPTTVGSYDYMIVTEAKTAAAAGATLFSVGTELDLLATDPNLKGDWDTLIADVRAAAPSLKLTYSANWSTAAQVTFWDKLDYVGIDGYVPLSNTTVTSGDPIGVAKLEAGWNTASNVDIAFSNPTTTVSQQLDSELANAGITPTTQNTAIDAFDQIARLSISGKFIFSEVGYQNDISAATDPTGASNQGTLDPTLQADLYTAFFDAWGAAQQTANGHGGLVDGIPFALAGAYIWNYTPDGATTDNWVPEQNGNTAAANAINTGFATPPPPIVVTSGHTSSGITLPRGATETVMSGGTARGTIILSGGTETISAGGKDFNAKIGGKQFVHGTATSAIVAAGGNQYVDAGGTASGGTVASGGIERVYGRASGGTVNSGGRQIVESGGVASVVTVKHGGNQTVFAGGVARGTVLSGGVETVRGTASGGRVNSGGTETVYGKASGGTINGGLIEVASGGTASGTVTFVSGGTLQLDAGASFTGAIKGFTGPNPLDRIDLGGIAFTLGATTKSFAQTTSSSGILTVTSGTHIVHLTLLGSYTTSNFKLATDGHSGTLVTDPPIAGGVSQLTFADIAPARLFSGAAAPGNPSSYLPGALGTNEQAHGGQTLLATGPPGGPDGANHHSLLLAPR